MTANIYCAGCLDPVIFQVVAPFWREYCEKNPDDSYLWLMRYGKGGEHLKVRLHGPEDRVPLQRQLLEERVTSFFAALPERTEPLEKKGWVGASPIDAEDDVEQDHPDRTFLWTTYKRSHISLGGKPFLDDDRFVTLFTRCMASGCELLLSLEPGEDGFLSHRTRQNALIKALIAGLAASGFSAEERADYLAYHRDWLLRFILPKDRRAEVYPVEQLQQSFEQRVARMGDALRPIGAAAEAEWSGNTAGKPQGLDARWRHSLADLLEYVRLFSNDPDYRLDPFATDQAFSPVFKVFHGFGNQMGLTMADEAFAHHILLRTTAVPNGALQETT
ncbi:MAG TPA: lantibiotic dehydratase C-terminal domain-containing protein [Thermoanaerobaculia bacterium]|nr:lantibiotic dehydratase C-terminal domain-containing protein [Thermoanaerobaculia bacterium]